MQVFAIVISVRLNAQYLVHHRTHTHDRTRMGIPTRAHTQTHYTQTRTNDSTMTTNAYRADPGSKMLPHYSER